MNILNETENITSSFDRNNVRWALKRAGNPHSLGISQKIPSSIENLRNAMRGSGHDCFMKGITVQMDMWVNKLEREQLLRYNHIDIVSSCSLMHKFHELITVDRCWSAVDPSAREFFMTHYSELPTEKGVLQLPMGFKYPWSIVTNALQLKTIESQRRCHKLPFWGEFLEHIDLLDIYIKLLIKGRALNEDEDEDGDGEGES